MVAVITGQNLGLGFGKVNNLSDQGLSQSQVGQNGQNVYVNAADGNLVIQNQDAVLVDNGLDLGVLRTYNSQGQFSDANGANWMTGPAAKSVTVSGTLGAEGSTVTRTDEDGSQSTYSWNSADQEYVLNGQGSEESSVPADSSLSVVNGQLVWSNGAGLSETYDPDSGQLLSTADPEGHQVVYSYNSDGTLASAVSDTGDAVYYDYANGQLTDIRTKTQDGQGNWQTETAVYYTYDSQNRLSTVTVDLSPSDNSIADGNVYTTTYTYDGTSNRIAGITQSDGTSLSFTYVQVGSEYRVATVTNGLQQTTTFSYNTTQLQTTIQDPLSATTVLTFDQNSRLAGIEQPATGATGSATSSTQFQYNPAGNLTTVTDSSGNSTVYGYDADGNQTSSVDAAGDTVTSTYNAANQLTSRTVYLAPASGTAAASQPETTRYYYAPSSAPGAPGLLTYIISANGGITEYLYNAQDQRVSTLVYTAQTLDASALTGNETTAQIAALVTAATPAADTGATTRTDVQRTDTTYDPHGQISTVTTYTAVANDADLTGVAADAATRPMCTISPASS
jgi:YD repeat-containing protein